MTLVDIYSIMGNMATQWIVLRRWERDSVLISALGFPPWQPACQIAFDTQAEATAHMLDLVPDFPGREFKVVEQNKG